MTLKKTTPSVGTQAVQMIDAERKHDTNHPKAYDETASFNTSSVATPIILTPIHLRYNFDETSSQKHSYANHRSRMPRRHARRAIPRSSNCKTRGDTPNAKPCQDRTRQIKLYKAKPLQEQEEMSITIVINCKNIASQKSSQNHMSPGQSFLSFFR